jgi:hypothetical protein
VYVVGYTNSTFANQTTAVNNNNNNNANGARITDAFIAKYDKDGNQVWVKQF